MCETNNSGKRKCVSRQNNAARLTSDMSRETHTEQSKLKFESMRKANHSQHTVVVAKYISDETDSSSKPIGIEIKL